MSAEEDLIDYSDEEIQTTDAVATGTDGAAAGANGEQKEGEAGAETTTKGSYVGIHSTGFRDFLLRPELLRAIQRHGFEHPSEG